MLEIKTYLAEHFLEIFSLVTGAIYLILEIKQKNVMWVVCIISSSVAAMLFFRERLFGSMALNIYYIFTAFWGLWSWMKDSQALKQAKNQHTEYQYSAKQQTELQDTVKQQTELQDTAKQQTATLQTESQQTIHIRRLTKSVAILSAVAFIIATPFLKQLLILLEGGSTTLDSMVFMLSIIATIWLVKSYLEQWLLWILADLLSTAMCITQQMYWMAALYAMYSVVAVYGYHHWKRHGVYV